MPCLVLCRFTAGGRIYRQNLSESCKTLSCKPRAQREPCANLLLLLEAAGPAKEGRRALSLYLRQREATETVSDSPLPDSTWREGRKGTGSAG